MRLAAPSDYQQIPCFEAMAFRQAFLAAGRVAKATNMSATLSANLTPVAEAVSPALGAVFARGFAAEAAPAPFSAGKVTQVC